MKFGDRLIQLRKEKHYTRDEFAQLLGISKYTLRNYELGITEPGHPFLIKIAGLFDTSIDYILGLTEEREKMHSYKLKTSEFEHIEKYRSLDPHGQQTVDLILDREAERVKQLLDTQGQLRQSQERITELESQVSAPNNIVPIVEEPVPDHLAVQAAHNDSIIDDEELSKMQRDMEMLKKYRK